MMGAHTYVIIGPGIGCEFCTATFPCPMLRGLDEHAPDAAMPGLRHDIPAFEVGDGAGPAPFGVRPEGELDEAGESDRVRRNEHGQRFL